MQLSRDAQALLLVRTQESGGESPKLNLAAAKRGAGGFERRFSQPLVRDVLAGSNQIPPGTFSIRKGHAAPGDQAPAVGASVPVGFVIDRSAISPRLLVNRLYTFDLNRRYQG